MRNKIAKLVQKGFFHIFGANVINKLIGFASSIFLIRILSKEDFGVFSYAENILMVFLLFNAVGATAGMLQFGSESAEKSKRDMYFKFGIKFGFAFNIFIFLVIILFGLFGPVQFEKARPIIVAMSAMPLIMLIMESVQIYFRTSLRNKDFSLLTTTNTALVFVTSVIGAIVFQTIGVVLFRYIAYFLTILLGIILLKDITKEILKSGNLLYRDKIEFIKFSLTQSFNNAIAQMLYVIDIFIIGLLIADTSTIASYKTATLIPFALNFIPSSIMVFIYPYFARNNKNINWIKSNYIKLTKYLIIFNALITILLVVFSRQIIYIAFGSEYKDAIVPFIILSIGYFIASSFRIPVGNILVMMKKVKFGLYLSVITGVLNIVLNFLLITVYGSIGAAISTLFVFIFTSFLGVGYLMRQFKILDKERKR